MANLIKAYLTKDGLPKNKEFIPGDVLIFEKTKKSFFWNDEIIDKLYIFDLNRKVRFICCVQGASSSSPGTIS
jgi:hypothetical protein